MKIGHEGLDASQIADLESHLNVALIICEKNPI